MSKVCVVPDCGCEGTVNVADPAWLCRTHNDLFEGSVWFAEVRDRCMRMLEARTPTDVYFRAANVMIAFALGAWSTELAPLTGMPPSTVLQ